YLSSHLLLLFCKLPSPPDIYTLSLHDALPIFFHHCKKVELPLFDDKAAAGLSQFFVWWSRVKKKLISISTGGINFCRAEAQFNSFILQLQEGELRKVKAFSSTNGRAGCPSYIRLLFRRQSILLAASNCEIINHNLQLQKNPPLTRVAFSCRIRCRRFSG